MGLILPPWLRCVNVQMDRLCHGKLQRHGTKLICSRCGYAYHAVQGIPSFLIEEHQDDLIDHYNNEAIIRTYYEAQYGPFIRPLKLTNKRLPLPAPHRSQRSQVHDDLALKAAKRLTIANVLTESFYRTILELCAPYMRLNMRVLDVGCGLGRVTGELARLTKGTVFGIDRSARMVQEAARIVMESGPHEIALNRSSLTSMPAMLDINWQQPNVGFAVADAQALPIADNSIDLIVCLNVLDRIRHPSKMIAEMQRVLRPDGKLVMTDPYHWDEKYTPLDEWVENMTDLFLPAQWRIVEEIDGIPFIMRYEPRRVTLYQNHCLLYCKVADTAPNGA